MADATPTLTSLLLYLSDDHGAARRRAVAAALARRFDATLTGLALSAPEPPLTLGDAAGVGTGGELWGAIAANAAARAEGLSRGFAAAFEGQTLRVEARAAQAPGMVAEAIALHARYADLTILPLPGAVAGDTEAEAHEALRGALFDSGRPVLLMPSPPEGGEGAEGAEAPPLALEQGVARSALVAWDGRKEAARAAHDALPLLAGARVEVATIETLISGGEEDRAAVAAAARWLGGHGIDATANVISRTFGIATGLLNRAAEIDADLIVMGGYGHSRLTEAIFGGVTETILGAAKIPVLMAH